MTDIAEKITEAIGLARDSEHFKNITESNLWLLHPGELAQIVSMASDGTISRVTARYLIDLFIVKNKIKFGLATEEEILWFIKEHKLKD